MSKFNNTLPGKWLDSIAQPGGLEEQYKLKKKKKSHLGYRECTRYLGLYSIRTLWTHQRRCSLCSPSKKEQLNPRKLPWICSKLPPQQKKTVEQTTHGWELVYNMGWVMKIASAQSFVHWWSKGSKMGKLRNMRSFPVLYIQMSYGKHSWVRWKRHRLFH